MIDFRSQWMLSAVEEVEEGGKMGQIQVSKHQKTTENTQYKPIYLEKTRC